MNTYTKQQQLTMLHCPTEKEFESTRAGRKRGGREGERDEDTGARLFGLNVDKIVQNISRFDP